MSVVKFVTRTIKTTGTLRFTHRQVMHELSVNYDGCIMNSMCFSLRVPRDFDLSSPLTIHPLVLDVSAAEVAHVSVLTRGLCTVFTTLALDLVSCSELSDRLSFDPFFFCAGLKLEPGTSVVRVTGRGGTRSVRELTSESTDLSPSEHWDRRYCRKLLGECECRILMGSPCVSTFLYGISFS